MGAAFRRAAGALMSALSWPLRLAWFSLPLFAVSALLLHLTHDGGGTDSAALLTMLNTLFCGAVSLLIAQLAGRTYLQTGSAPVLFLGSGSLVFAVTSLIAGPLLSRSTEQAVMFHNIGVLVAGTCFLASARLATSEITRAVAPAAATRWLVVAYGAALIATGLVLWGSVVHAFPDFYVVGEGMTPLRQGVLGVAVAEYLLAALYFVVLHRRSGTPFLLWYGLGLALIGLGLGTLIPEGAPGTALSWVGRSGQYLGGLYLLFAVMSVVRDSGAWGLPLDSREQTVRRLASFPEQNPNPVIEIDVHGVVSYRNAATRAVLRRLGLPDDARVFFPEDFGAMLDALRRGEELADQSRDVPVGDRFFRESVNVLPRLSVIRIYAHDFTEQKRAELDRLRLLEELKRSNHDLEQFASVASHDLQEPLRAVAGYASLLQARYRGALDGQADTFLQGAADGAARMQRLIDDLLVYSRVGTRGGALQAVDAGAALDVALANLEAAIREAGAIVLRDPLPAVRADAGQLAQLFQNLVGNAIKFHGDRNPQIRVGAARQPGAWVFSVQDNGIGIDPLQQERAFAIFQRLHPRSRYPGTGIGLAICKRIVERHGGRIWVESAPGRGSTFFFTLPEGAES